MASPSSSDRQNIAPEGGEDWFSDASTTYQTDIVSADEDGWSSDSSIANQENIASDDDDYCVSDCSITDQLDIASDDGDDWVSVSSVPDQADIIEQQTWYKIDSANTDVYSGREAHIRIRSPRLSRHGRGRAGRQPAVLSCRKRRDRPGHSKHQRWYLEHEREMEQLAESDDWNLNDPEHDGAIGQNIAGAG